ncbi:PD40 domain-containing protein [Bacillus sp. Marseille-P3661]|uniref:PD40 domain-containing protein n=1 Tax=Bacillus sp. Marseille-P3661 TaxID=1936234 RepID=UPI000C835DE2|nr:PD40 domain-containing protein [Bacillus sp. Marseille-P3661]
MLKIFLFLVVCLLSFPGIPLAAEDQTKQLKAAFIKEDNLWIKVEDNEKKITDGEFVRFPKWSNDGTWIAYLKGEKNADFPINEGELWLYDTQKDIHTKVATHIMSNFQWAPNENKIGFQSTPSPNESGFESAGRLFMADVRDITNNQHIASKISNFSWLPDGKGFILSSKIDDQVDANIVVSKIILDPSTENFLPIHVHTIPVEKDEFIISTSGFKWSNDGQWVAFLLNPTASLSADSNILGVLSQDGKVFKKFSGMLDDEEWFQWAPTQALLGTINGEGREAISNKQLKIYNLLQDTTEIYTPLGFVDRDLTWVNDHQIITSRSAETIWMDVEERPLPSLVKTDLNMKKHTNLTSPSPKEGDFRPQYIDDHLIWIRTDRETADVWVTNLDSTKPKKWITNINLGSYYYEKWNWDEVLSLW